MRTDPDQAGTRQHGGLADEARVRAAAEQIQELLLHRFGRSQVLAAFDAGLGDPDTIPQDNGCFNTLLWKGGGWAVLGVNELPEGP